MGRTSIIHNNKMVILLYFETVLSNSVLRSSSLPRFIDLGINHDSLMLILNKTLLHEEFFYVIASVNID